MGTLPDFSIDSLRGGQDDFTPISALAKDACALAENVEFFYSTLGERRAGCSAIANTIPAGISGDAVLDAVVWMFHHQPTTVESADELWVITRDTDDVCKCYRLKASGWTTVTFPTANDTPLMTNNNGYNIYAVSLHGKMYMAYKSAVDRLHCWDGTSIRVVGLAAHAAAPTVANTGGGTYSAVARYYRTRSIVKTGTVVNRRSEPSANSTVFTPSGGGTAALVTRPTDVGEGTTHWEIEGSLDGTTFYRLSQVVIGTTTYSDSASVETYSANTLSDPLLSYDLIPSVKYLATDEDRLILGGSWQTTADGSAVRWTPVGLDPLPGADERLDDNNDPRLDLDGLEGGDITNVSRVINGSIIIHKNSHIYKLMRTGQLVGSYEAQCMTKSRGALPRSVIEASDQQGRPALYFLDPKTGPMRIGANGLEFCGYDTHTIWQRVNPSAILPCHGVYYAAKYQVHWWVSLDAETYPANKLVLQTNEMRSGSAEQGARRGWSIVPTPARIAAARCSVMWATNIATPTLTQVPFIGKTTWTV